MSQRGGIEISATSVDEAVAFALEQLGCGPADVDVEILREPDEPDEHGYISDEALVLVTPRAVAPPARSAPQARPEGSSRRALSAGDRMRIAQIGQETLSDLLHHIGLVASCRANPATVDTPDGDTPVLLEVEGEDLGVLIGRRGESLAALEYILNLLIQKHVSVWPNVQVDVAGYRRRREEVLEGLARRMARRVMETQQPFTFEPMPARERRILHMAIQEDGRVTTQSIGEGEDRRVVIYPAD